MRGNLNDLLRTLTMLKRNLGFVALLCACSDSPVAPIENCTGYGPWQTSVYVLPYPVGTTYLVDQGNCSPPGNGHRGTERYAYDFLAPIGSEVTAARSGSVLHVEESHFDGEIAPSGFDNYVAVQHTDGSVALYSHLTHNGASVTVGSSIVAGERVGFTGNTGNTGNKPHLHFSVHVCDPVLRGSAACPTMPVTFRNTAPNTNGLVRGSPYTAEAFVSANLFER